MKKKNSQRDANTARALALVRFGHRPPVTDRTDYNTLRRRQLARSVTTQPICSKFPQNMCGKTAHGPRKNPLDFDRDINEARHSDAETKTVETKFRDLTANTSRLDPQAVA